MGILKQKHGARNGTARPRRHGRSRETSKNQGEDAERSSSGFPNWARVFGFLVAMLAFAYTVAEGLAGNLLAFPLLAPTVFLATRALRFGFDR